MSGALCGCCGAVLADPTAEICDVCYEAKTSAAPALLTRKQAERLTIEVMNSFRGMSGSVFENWAKMERNVCAVLTEAVDE